MDYTEFTIPADESERLAELGAFNILDTEAEEAFDSLTRLAAHICCTPISLVSLVDAKRQWFKSRVAFEASETPRDISFCTHAILDPDQLFVVRDASKDERFRRNPLVTDDPKIRFYAGMPLKTRTGSAIGTLCVIDRVPRDLSDTQREALVNLSRAVVAQLRLRQRLYRHERFYAMVARANAAVARASDAESLCREACHAGVAIGNLKMVWIGRLDSATDEVRLFAWDDATDGESSETIALRLAKDPLERALAAEALATGEVRISNDTCADTRIRSKEPRLEQGYLACAVLPLSAGGKPWGTLNLYAGQKKFFDTFYVDRATELAGDLSFGLDRLQKAKELHYLSFYDAVTGWPNRLFLEDKFRTVAQQIPSGCLLLIAMERIHQIGTAYGSSTADAILKQAAQRLAASAQEKAILASVRSGHFALFLPEGDPANFSRMVTQCLAPALAAPYRVGDHEIGCPGRFGASFFPDDGATFDALFTAAELALQGARNVNQAFRFYNKKRDDTISEQLRLETDLRRALERREFINHYQPKVDLATGKIAGAEALMRWQHPERGLVPPAQFIPALESSGLILEAGQQALARAIADWRNWQDSGLNAPRIAINATILQLTGPNFVREIEAELSTNGVGPRALSIELTESSLMNEAEKVTVTMRALRKLGIPIAIDDFGTGYSSLAYLATLPIDELKIDRSFVIRMTEEAAYMGLVNTIISLAHGLNLKVVAEGVETEEQAKLLRLLKCEQAQGYLYSKPVSAKDFTTLLTGANFGNQ